jgi:hypothetical protein
MRIAGYQLGHFSFIHIHLQPRLAVLTACQHTACSSQSILCQLQLSFKISEWKAPRGGAIHQANCAIPGVELANRHHRSVAAASTQTQSTTSANHSQIADDGSVQERCASELLSHNPWFCL